MNPAVSIAMAVSGSFPRADEPSLGEATISFWIALVVVLALIVFAQLSLSTLKGRENV